ncbi:hypothetical protein PBAC_25470 [Pedobacter glucosidilyticus]|nr:hypothetical protein [Pedobacter glucosidilyticus]KHJ37217.1 hypothetical protein PBAC_25470 [Pedobacter glucosidilyticus]
MNKKEYISKLANFLIENGKSMDAISLAKHLNWNGYLTNYETPYEGKRGVYTLIHSVYDWLINNNRIQEADNVAKAYKKTDGSYAYHK